jgi:signal transduction histidine kinase
MRHDSPHSDTVAKTHAASADELLQILAHDLRNPLHAAYLAASIITTAPARDMGSARVRAAAHSITRSIERANRMILDLLDMSRIDAGQLVLYCRPIAALALVIDAIELLALPAEAAGVALSADVPRELPAVHADAERVLQVFSNLIGNAIKFTPRGGSVCISTRTEHDSLCFCVADTGPGIEPDQLPHVFDRFFQGQPGDRRGTGLGLSIARGIIAGHRGRIWAESANGRGTRIYFTVPFADAPHRAGT